MANIDGAIMETDSEYAERVSKLADSMFTIDEICDIWHSCYGEDLKEEYSGFIDALKFTIALEGSLVESTGRGRQK